MVDYFRLQSLRRAECIESLSNTQIGKSNEMACGLAPEGGDDGV